ncbi:MAG TPA: NAD(P)H-binding protein [Kofleriaceae bacterium]|jgi:uncharacterized protein YbjT (DUF2867 family)
MTAGGGAFVFGATGFVGREVVRQLCARGTQVRAHVRPDSSQLAEWRKTFGDQGALVDTAAWDPAALSARLGTARPAQLYILIGTTRKKARTDSVQGDIYEAVDLGLTQIAVDAARTAVAAGAPAPRIVYLSSLGADPKARSAYLRARGKAEAAVTTSGLPWVIARPSIITGERDDSRAGERTAAVVGDGLLSALRLVGAKGLAAKYRSTTPDILAAALIRLADAPAHDLIADGAALRS